MNKKVGAALVAVGLLVGCGGGTKTNDLGSTPKPVVFDCPEDALMVWAKPRTQGVCINEQEYMHAVHALAGHVAMTPEDERIARYLPAQDGGHMDHGGM